LYFEQDKLYTVPLCGGDFYKAGLIRPSAVLSLCQRVVDTHLALCGADLSVLGAHHLSWVFILTAMRIRPIPQTCMALTAKTWMSEQRGPYYRREMEFYTQQGERLICISSYSVLIDLLSRAILRPSALPISLIPPNPVFTIPDITPKLVVPTLKDHCYDDIIRQSQIDLLGHVNNSCYADFTFNCLTREELSKGICEMDINFLAELRNGSSFCLFRGEDEDGAIWTKGLEKDSGKTSFTSKIRLFE
jgi:acyl-ACP thioesterase